MKDITAAIRTLDEVQALLGSVKELREVLVETRMSVLTEVVDAIRKGWHLKYESHATSSGPDYDDHFGDESWRLSGPELSEPKYWHGGWDHRSTGIFFPKELWELLPVSVRTRNKYANEVLRALSVLSGIFSEEGGDSI